MRTVKEVSKLTGVSIRTLHYYDKIGLLKPAEYMEFGYRLNTIWSWRDVWGGREFTENIDQVGGKGTVELAGGA